MGKPQRAGRIELETVGADDLRGFAATVLASGGMPAADAGTLADAMVWADLRGISKQGVLRLPLAIERMRSGGTRANAELVVHVDRPSFAVLGGAHRWGPVLGVEAMRRAIAKARTTGVGAVTVRDTTFAFALGYYPDLAIRERMIALAINDTLPLMAPPGGTKKVIGNQAFAMGWPARRHPPVLLDTALSGTTWTAIHEMQERGERVPEGLAVGPDERPTTDPALALAGRLLPIGGVKGFGIGLMWEILTGILSGGALFGEQLRGPDDVARPMGTSLFMLAIDPSAAMPYERFLDRVDELIDQLRSSPTEPGIERIYTPGERSYRLAAERERSGIPLATSTVSALRSLADALGVTWPATRA